MDVLEYPRNSAAWSSRPRVARAGEILQQSDLAESLREIARHGPDAFYRGTLAGRIVDGHRPPRKRGQPRAILRGEGRGGKPAHKDDRTRGREFPGTRSTGD